MTARAWSTVLQTALVLSFALYAQLDARPAPRESIPPLNGLIDFHDWDDDLNSNINAVGLSESDTDDGDDDDDVDDYSRILNVGDFVEKTYHRRQGELPDKPLGQADVGISKQSVNESKRKLRKLDALWGGGQKRLRIRNILREKLDPRDHERLQRLPLLEARRAYLQKLKRAPQGWRSISAFQE